MTPSLAMQIGSETIYTALSVVAPIMAVGFVVGLTISLIQAIMQIQEMTLAFVPKLVAIGLSIIYFGGFMLEKLMDYAKMMFTGANTFLGG